MSFYFYGFTRDDLHQIESCTKRVSSLLIGIVAESCKTVTGMPGENYCYQWWNLVMDSGGKPCEIIWANGWGGQFIYIIPELDAVIVSTGHNYENDSWAISRGIAKYLHYL